jgi:hypothetical protein
MTSVPLRSSAGPRANTLEFRITSTVGPWTTEAWQEELGALTRHVKRCFEHATPRFVSPSEDGCRYFANCLMTYFLPGEKRPPGSKEKAVKHGRTFLKHLAQERETIELGLRVNIAFKLDEETRQKSESTLFHMREVEQHLEYLFDVLSPKRSPKNDWVRWLADLAQDLWRETNDGRAPRSKKADGPICRLLLPVLKAIHRNPSPRSIEAALRGRR